MGSLVSIFVASPTHTPVAEVTWWGEYPGFPERGFEGADFWMVFAVFFPATTGILRLRSRIPADCTVSFHEHGGSPGIQLPYDSPVLQKAKDALSDEWSNPAVMIGMGGSIPVVGDFQTMLGMDSVLVGFGLADDRIHSPNEKYALKSYHKGQRSWARILAALAAG